MSETETFPVDIPERAFREADAAAPRAFRGLPVVGVVQAAAPILVAAELRRLAETPDPVARVARVWLLNRAADLDPEPPRSPAWQVGDRVVFRHVERVGRRNVTVGTLGTVRAVDEPRLPPGVRVDLDEPVCGVRECYATHDELARATPLDSEPGDTVGATS